jgi:tetratricopeptide (TPR) repeat protein
MKVGGRIYFRSFNCFFHSRNIRSCLILLAVFTNLSYSGQNKELDSLKLVLKNAKHDTVKCNALVEMINRENDINVWTKYNDQLTQIAGSHLKDSVAEGKEMTNVYKKHFAGAINNTGYIYNSKGDVSGSLKFFLQSLSLLEQIRNVDGSIADKKGVALALNSIGTIYHSRGDIPKALEYYSKSLKLQEESGDKLGAAYTLNNLGVISHHLGDTAKALEYYLKCFIMREEIGDKKGMASSLNNIGSIYQGQMNYKKAMDCYERCLKIQEEIKDKKGMCTSLLNLGTFYHAHQDLDKALECYEKATGIAEEIGDKISNAFCLRNVGAVYLQKNDLSRATRLLSQSLSASKEIGRVELISGAAKLLAEAYKKKGDHKSALNTFELYIQMRDSLNSEATRKANIRSQLKYEYEKQAAADSVAHAKENEIKSAELSRQSAEIKAKKNQQVALFGGLFLVILFAGFMNNRFKVTQKQKGIIETQKEIVEGQKKLVEGKQSEILDSIRYAKRIQLAQIPTEKRVASVLARLKR